MRKLPKKAVTSTVKSKSLARLGGPIVHLLTDLFERLHLCFFPLSPSEQLKQDFASLESLITRCLHEIQHLCSRFLENVVPDRTTP